MTIYKKYMFSSALNMVQIVNSVNYGLKILNMNHISQIEKLIPDRIKMNMSFKTKYVRKRRIWDRKIHKTMIIPVDVHERNKKFTVTVWPKNACKLEFVDHLWLPVLDQ